MWPSLRPLCWGQCLRLAEVTPPLLGTQTQALGPDQCSPHSPEVVTQLPPGWGDGGHTHRRSHSVAEPAGSRRVTRPTEAGLRLARHTSAEGSHACAHERRGSVSPRPPAPGVVTLLPVRVGRVPSLRSLPGPCGPGTCRPDVDVPVTSGGSCSELGLLTGSEPHGCPPPHRRQPRRSPGPWGPKDRAGVPAPYGVSPGTPGPSLQLSKGLFFLLTNLRPSSGPKSSREFSVSFHVRVFNPPEMGRGCP